MSFENKVNSLKTELSILPLIEEEIVTFIKKCSELINDHFASDSKASLQLRSITTKPKTFYFPEMYNKIQESALIDCKKSLTKFLENLESEFEKEIVDKPIEELLKSEENQYLEFKSTLCWDIKNSKADKRLMGEIIMKSISAFSNSDGGILLIGVDNEKNILGLSNDYQIFNNGKGSQDDFELHLTTLIINNFSKTFAKENLTIEYPLLQQKKICLIRIKKGNIPYTIRTIEKGGQSKEKFFIRIKNSSRDIDDLIEFAKYIKFRFPDFY